MLRKLTYFDLVGRFLALLVRAGKMKGAAWAGLLFVLFAGHACGAVSAQWYSGTGTLIILGGTDLIVKSSSGNVVVSENLVPVTIMEGATPITVSCGDLAHLILEGTSGPDILDCGQVTNQNFGYLETVVIKGYGDDDTISGSDKGDVIYGGVGNDGIYAGPGDDVIYGGDGTDYIDGEEGNNLIGDELWVDADGGDNGNTGTVQGDPLETVQAAFDMATNGATILQLVLTQGHLRTSTCTTIHLSSRRAGGVTLFL